MCYDAGWTRMEKPIWGTVREVVSCELVRRARTSELAPREYITMRPSHISHTRYLLYGKRKS